MTDWAKMIHFGREIKIGDIIAVIYDPKTKSKSEPKEVNAAEEIHRLREALKNRISFKSKGTEAFEFAGDFLADGFDPESRKAIRKMFRTRAEIAVFEGDVNYLSAASTVFEKCFGPRTIHFGVFVGKCDDSPEEPFYMLKAFSTQDKLIP